MLIGIIIAGGDQVMLNDFNRLKCPHCRSFYKNSDIVVLDEMNTVIHMSCHTKTDFEVKDRGTYRSIIGKYEMFKEMR